MNLLTISRGATSIHASRHLQDWMQAHKVSFVLTTSHDSRLLLLGLDEHGALAASGRAFAGSRSLAQTNDGNGFFMASQQRIWRFDNVLGHGEVESGCDRLYLQNGSIQTGDLEVRDIAVDADGRLTVLDRERGIAVFTPQGTLKTLWRPAAGSGMAPEMRWKLSGMAMREGRPAYVAATSQAGGGVLFDVGADVVAAGGLLVPNSPRWHKGKLWLADAGTGFFGYADLKSGRFVPICFCQGYVHGLAFHGDFAVVALSQRLERAGAPLSTLQANLAARFSAARCGIQVIDLHAGEVVHWMVLDELRDIYDVAVLENVRRPLIATRKNGDGEELSGASPQGHALN